MSSGIGGGGSLQTSSAGGCSSSSGGAMPSMRGCCCSCCRFLAWPNALSCAAGPNDAGAPARGPAEEEPWLDELRLAP